MFLNNLWFTRLNCDFDLGFCHSCLLEPYMSRILLVLFQHFVQPSLCPCKQNKAELEEQVVAKDCYFSATIDPCKKKPPVCDMKTQRCINGDNFNKYTCQGKTMLSNL